jgi:hypothetical protein
MPNIWILMRVPPLVPQVDSSHDDDVPEAAASLPFVGDLVGSSGSKNPGPSMICVVGAGTGGSVTIHPGPSSIIRTGAGEGIGAAARIRCCCRRVLVVVVCCFCCRRKFYIIRKKKHFQEEGKKKKKMLCVRYCSGPTIHY